MKIKKIELYGYGKWINQTFDLEDNFQVFYGKNEAGKSTLMSFVHSVLFGFPSKQGAHLRYEPRNANQYGGRLTLSETIYGEVLVERVKGTGNGSVTVTLPDGRQGKDELLKQIVYGLDKNTYQALFSFNLEGLQKVQQLNDSKLNRYFLSIGTAGNEQLLKIADKFQELANKLYKPTGRVPEINQKIALLKQKEQQLKKAKAKNAEYNQLMAEGLALTASLQKNQEKRESLEKSLAQYHRLKSNWMHFNEIQAIQQQIKKEHLTDLPADGLYQLKQVNDELERINKEIIQGQEQVAYLSQKSGQSQEFSFYLEHKSALKEVVADIDWIQPTLQNKEVLQAKYLQAQYYLEQALTKVGLPIYGELPAPLTPHQQQMIQEHLDKEEQLGEEKEAFHYEEQRINFQLEACNQEIDKLEGQLWANKEFQEFQPIHPVSDAEASRSSKNDSTKKQVGEKKKAFIGVAVGTLLLMVGFLLASGLGWALVAVGVIFLFGSGYLATRKTVQPVENAEIPTKEEKYSYEDYIKQVEVRRLWREKLAEIDELTNAMQQLSLQKGQLETQQLQLVKEEQEIKTTLRIPLDFSLASIATTDPFLDIRQQIQQLEKQEAELAEQNQKLTAWYQKAEFCKSVLTRTTDKLGDFIFAVQQYYHKQQEIEKGLAAISQQVLEVQQRLNFAKNQRQEYTEEKNRLFQLVGVTTEEEYHKKYVFNQQLQQKKERLNLLETQLAEDMVLFNQYRDEVALEEATKEAKAALMTLKAQQEIALNQKAQCDVALRNLEEGGQYSVLLQEFANIKSEFQELVNQWSRYRVAAELIEETLKIARKDRLPDTIEDASVFFRTLTENNYQRILFNDEQLEVQRQDGTIFLAQELSTGTAEQLYVALRLAFVKNTADLVKMPLLIDDGFVNFDKERKKLVLTVLRELSQTNQILYFTYDDEIYKEIPQIQVKVLQ